MAIIATFTDGLTSVKVHGLTQWDYGQTLELRDPTLPAVIEVHFAFPGLTEAIKRSCSAVSGVASVAIPDACLEQNAPVMAWVYEVGATSGRTIRTVVLPIEPRQRPAPYEDIPVEVSNLYTEAISTLNQVVDDFRDDLASGSISASRAIADSEGNHIASTYAAFTRDWVTASALPGPGVYLIRLRIATSAGTPYTYYLAAWSGIEVVQLPGRVYGSGGQLWLHSVTLLNNGKLSVGRMDLSPLSASRTSIAGWTWESVAVDDFQYKRVSGLTAEAAQTLSE